MRMHASASQIPARCSRSQGFMPSTEAQRVPALTAAFTARRGGQRPKQCRCAEPGRLVSFPPALSAVAARHGPAQSRVELRRKTRPSGLDKCIRLGQTSEDEIVSDKLITTRPYAIRAQICEQKSREGQFVALGRGGHGKVAGQDSVALRLVQNRQNDTCTTNARTLQQGRNLSHSKSLSC